MAPIYYHVTVRLIVYHLQKQLNLISYDIGYPVKNGINVSVAHSQSEKGTKPMLHGAQQRLLAGDLQRL